MWSKVTTLSALNSEGRWSVELFASLEAPKTPSTYPFIQIGDLVTERSESLLPGRWPSYSFAYIGLENVVSQTGLLDSFQLKPGSTIQSTSGVFRPGDVLYGRLRPYLNKVFVAEGDVTEGICSGEFFVLTPIASRVRPLYLRELLASAYVADVVKGMQFGSALPRLQLTDLLKVSVPVPSLTEQLMIEDQLRTCRGELSRQCNWVKTAGIAIRDAFEIALAQGEQFNIPHPTPTSSSLPTPGLPPDYHPSTRSQKHRPPRLPFCPNK